MSIQKQNIQTVNDSNLYKHRGQGDAQRLCNFKTSKANCFAAKIIDCYSFVFIAAHVKRLLDPSVLSPDVDVCFRTPGTTPCRFFTCLEHYVTTWPPFINF